VPLYLGGTVAGDGLAVRDFHSHPELQGLEPGKGAKQRTKSITQVVLHWTGGEGNVHRFMRTCLRRGVGAHFFIDRAGVIHQLADPLELATYHAGSLANARSIGIEMACYGFRSPARTRWNLRAAPKVARDRDVYRALVGPRWVYLADFYPQQYRAMGLLCQALAEELPGIAPMVPLDSQGVCTHRLSKTEARAFSGFMGHLHVPGSTKIDPGPRVFENLLNRFARLV